MTKRILLAAVLAGLLTAGGSVLAQHEQGAGEVACVGERHGGRCDVVWATYSVESRNADRGTTNCPKGTTSKPECYRDYRDSRDSEAEWGPGATEQRIGETSAGPVTFGGLYDSGIGQPSGRLWTGVAVAGLGQGSVAAGGAIDAEDRTVYGCLIFYGADDTDGHVIATQTNALQGHDNDDFDTDVSFCGVLLNGV